MDRSTRRTGQRRRKTKGSNGAKDAKDGEYEAVRSPPPALSSRSRSLLQQDKDHGDGTAASDSDSDDETDSDKETTVQTLLQALNTSLEDADHELKRANASGDDANGAVETVLEFKDRMLELRKKVQMIEDGTFTEYCRRCVEFKDERARSLETAKQHKELQLKNIEDLRRFDLQRAENLYATAKQRVKKTMIARIQAMLTDVDEQILALEAQSEEPLEQVQNESDKQAVDVQVDENPEEEEAQDVPVAKKARLDIAGLQLSGPLVDHVKAYQPGHKKLPFGVFTGVNADDAKEDILAVCSDWKPAPETSPALEKVSMHYAQGILWCGKYIFDEGDEVVVSSNVMKREYVGVIHALTSNAVYLLLRSGEKARVQYNLLETKRCELKPIFRGNAGIKNIQSSGWVRCDPF